MSEDPLIDPFIFAYRQGQRDALDEEQAHGHYDEGYKFGYARGLIEGDSGGRREGYRSGYAAGKDAVMTSSYAEAVAVGRAEGVETMLDRVRQIVVDTRHEDACCSRGCACQTHDRPEPCDLLCNCMVGSVVSASFTARSKSTSSCCATIIC